MSKKLGLLLAMGLAASLPKDPPTKISSHRITQKKEEIQLSKQRLQKMKGKGARKNRGKNRRKKWQ